MTAITASLNDLWSYRGRIDRVWALIPIILGLIAIFAPADFPMVLDKATSAFIGTAPFIAFAICATAYLRAASAEGVVAQAFTGDPVRMVVAAALVGGLSPFCSCEVIPFIAALLAMGVPLSAVMAFWLASPLMDPPMFLITAGEIGMDFAVAKTIAGVSIGLIGGFGVMMLMRTGIFDNPLRPDGLAAKRAAEAAAGQEVKVEGGCCGPAETEAVKTEAATCGASTGCGPAKVERAELKVEGGCCGGDDAEAPSVNAFVEKPVWKFWTEAKRVETFKSTAIENFLFLGKWLALAYVIEAMMIRYIPAESIATILGGDGLGTILLASVVGAPAYLNGYAAAPLAATLMEQGMNPGAAMSFMLAGGVTSIPAMVAVYSLVRWRIFAGYLGFALIGAVTAGLSFAAWAG